MPELNFSEAELDRLADLLADRVEARVGSVRDPIAPAAYTPKTLAAELGRSERSIRAAIARGELAAVKRGRGYLIAADAVEAWAQADPGRPTRARRRASPSRGGVMARALSRRT